MQYEIQLKEIPAVKVLGLRETIGSYSEEHTLWHRLGLFLSQQGIACPEAEEAGYSLYHDEDHRDKDVDVEVAVPVQALGESREGFVYRELEALPLAATLRFAGPYEGYGAAMGQLAAWIEEKGYEICGNTRGVALRTSQDQSNPENYLTELQIPVKKL